MKKIFLFSYIFFSIMSFAQNKDSVTVYNLNSVTIIADKYETGLINRTSSVNIINSEPINSFIGNGLTTALIKSSGLNFTSSDGLGKNPILSVRGYYGGGVSEYVTLRYDGMPINDVENGLINWDLIPFANNNIEVYKGGASSLYGDFSLGGVINIVPNFSDTSFHSFSIAKGNFGFTNGKYEFNFDNNNLNLSAYLIGEQIDGFRSHSKSQDYSFGTKLKYILNSKSEIKFLSINQISKADIPGVNSESNLIADKSSSLSYFKADKNDEKRYYAMLEYKYLPDKNSDLTASFSYKHKTANQIETFFNFSPIINMSDFSIIGIYDTTYFGDTNEREFSFNDYSFNLNYFRSLSDLNIKFILGVELEGAYFNNKYYNWFNGFEEDYNNTNLSKGEMTLDSKGNRVKKSIFINTEYRPVNMLGFNIGLRYDMINDELNGVKPDTSFSSDSKAFSPKLGINFRYSNSGAIHFNYNKAFKAPTIYQLTDLSSISSAIFLPFGPMFFQSIYDAQPFSNSKLKPQISDNFEIGVIQSFNFNKYFVGNFSATAYYSTVKDEIDFDMESFSYKNLLNTVHKGLELDFVSNIGSVNAFANFTINFATFKEGEYKNNYLKGMPKYFANFGVANKIINELFLAVSVNYNGKVFLDDENENFLIDYVTANLRLSYKKSFYKLTITVDNVFNNQFFMPGYMIGNQKMLYSSAGRIIKGEISFEI